LAQPIKTSPAIFDRLNAVHRFDEVIERGAKSVPRRLELDPLRSGMLVNESQLHIIESCVAI
jgi:hypothetical protein